MKKLIFSTKGIGIDWVTLALRIVFAGLMLINHGQGKLNNILNWTTESKFGDPIGVGDYNTLGLAVFTEFFCAIFLILGLFSRISTALLAFTMGVAFFLVHAGDPFGKKESSLIYMSVFALLFFTGPGKFSIDAMISGKKK